MESLKTEELKEIVRKLVMEIENLYKDVKKDQKDTKLREIQIKLDDALKALYKNSNKEALDALMNVQMKIEDLFCMLNENADSKLREVQSIVGKACNSLYE